MSEQFSIELMNRHDLSEISNHAAGRMGETAVYLIEPQIAIARFGWWVSTSNPPRTQRFSLTFRALLERKAVGLQRGIARSVPRGAHATGLAAAIQNVLNAGLQVIAHSDPVNVPRWSGTGSSVLNPRAMSGGI